MAPRAWRGGLPLVAREPARRSHALECVDDGPEDGTDADAGLAHVVRHWLAATLPGNFQVIERSVARKQGTRHRGAVLGTICSSANRFFMSSPLLPIYERTHHKLATGNDSGQPGTARWNGKGTKPFPYGLTAGALQRNHRCTAKLHRYGPRSFPAVAET